MDGAHVVGNVTVQDRGSDIWTDRAEFGVIRPPDTPEEALQIVRALVAGGLTLIAFDRPTRERLEQNPMLQRIG